MHTFKFVDALDFAVQLVGQDQAGHFWDLHREVGGACFLVGNTKKRQWSTALGLPNALHGSNFGRLVLQGVKAVHVAHQELQRNHASSSEDGRTHGFVGAACGAAFEQLPSAQTSDQERSGQCRGEQLVGKPVRKGGVKNHRQPIGGDELAVDDFETCRGVHPGVQAQNPEGRHGGAKRDQKSGNQVHPLAYPAATKEHDAQKAGLQEKRRQHLIAQQRP